MPNFKDVSATSNSNLLESQLSPKSASLEISIDSTSPKNAPTFTLNTSEDALSLDELKKRIYGGKLSANKVS